MKVTINLSISELKEIALSRTFHICSDAVESIMLKIKKEINKNLKK
jgi:hypothetical protein